MGVSFLEYLYSYPIRRDGMDSLCWTPSSKGIFEVCSYYSVLIQSTDTYFPWRSVWNSKVPSRVAFFIWIASLGKILTRDGNGADWDRIMGDPNPPRTISM